MTITKDMTIGEVMEKYPGLADTMTQHGLHCVGCHVNPFESIEEGTLGHGMAEEELQKLLHALNMKADEVQKIMTEQPIVSITEKAATQVKMMLQQQQKSDHALRFRAVAGGCAGYQYEITFTKEKSPEDVVLDQHGLPVYIDKESASVVRGAEVDYVDGLVNAGFKIKNTQKSGCGCGNSFGA